VLLKKEIIPYPWNSAEYYFDTLVSSLFCSLSQHTGDQHDDEHPI
jgi:hypothetical protein